MRIAQRSTTALFPPVHETLDTGHGRIDGCRIQTTTALNGYIDFPHAHQLARVQRQVTRAGRTTTETAWLITSIAPTTPCQSFGACNRGRCASIIRPGRAFAGSSPPPEATIAAQSGHERVTPRLCATNQQTIVLLALI